MKQHAQSRLSSGQIEAIRRKRRQGWTPRQIEADTGIDHVTVWRYTKSIKPITEGENTATNSEQAPVTPPSATPSSTGLPYPSRPTPSVPATYQDAQPMVQLQPALQQPPFSSPPRAPVQESRIREIVVERVVERRPIDPYDRLLQESVAASLRSQRIARARETLANIERATRERQARVENERVAEQQARDNQAFFERSNILRIVGANAAARVNAGMDPKEAAKKSGEDLDTLILLRWMYSSGSSR